MYDVASYSKLRKEYAYDVFHQYHNSEAERCDRKAVEETSRNAFLFQAYTRRQVGELTMAKAFWIWSGVPEHCNFLGAPSGIFCRAAGSSEARRGLAPLSGPVAGVRHMPFASYGESWSPLWPHV